MTDEIEPDVHSNDVRGDMETPNTLERRNPYDVAVPETLRERLAYARMLAQAGILPKDYRANPANVLVAGEMGRELSLSTIQSVLLLDVVEGRPSLGAKGVRATVQRAGHYISGAVIEYNAAGVPVAATVTGKRVDTDQEETVRWPIERAHRAGLCRLVRDDAGEIVEVRARSQGGKVLPWEAYTEDMLDARATTKLGRALFGDVTMGLSYERDELEGPGLIADAGTKVTATAEPTARAQEVLQQVKPTRRTDLPDEYDPAADLAEAGQEWWLHAGAQVSRRNKQQLAADRIAKWVADNPGQDTVPEPPLPDTDESTALTEATPPADAEIDPTQIPGERVDLMCDYPGCVRVAHETGDHVDINDDVLVPEPDWDDEPESAEDPVDVEPDEAPEVADPPVETPVDAGPVVEDVPTDDAPDLGEGEVALTKAELLAEIDAAAETVGKSRQALMLRWIASHRKNPEDDSVTAEDLLPFVEQLRATLAARG